MKNVPGHVSKKEPSRFTIKFNPSDPQHAKAIEALTAVGRCKAALIADALCKYCGTNTAEDLRLVAVTGKQKQDLTPLQESASSSSPLQAHQEVVRSTQPHNLPDSHALIPQNTDADATQSDEGDLWQAISDSVDAFFDNRI